MRPFLWRFLDRDDDEIAPGPFRHNMRGGKMSFFPAVGLFRQFAFRVVDVNRNLGSLHLGPHPEPVLVSFEELLADRLLLAYAEVATPIVFSNLKPFFDIWFRSLQRERLSIVDGCARAHQRYKKQADK